MRVSMGLPKRGTAVVTETLVVATGLDLDARREFVAAVSEAVGKAAGSDGCVGLDCFRVGTLDEQTLGMLVTVARTAQWRGARITLLRASTRLRARLDNAGISHFFDWQP